MRILVDVLGMARGGARAHSLLSQLDRPSLRAAAESAFLVALVDGRPSVQAGAAEALGLLKSTAALDRLVEALSSEDVEVRRSAAFSLGAIADPRAAEPLLAVAGDAAQPHRVRTGAILALRQLRSPRVDAALREIAKRDGEHPDIATAVLAVVGPAPGDDAPIDALVRDLRDPDPRVRERAVIVIQTCKDRRLVGPLIAIMRTDERPLGSTGAALLLIGMKEVLEPGPFVEFVRDASAPVGIRTFSVRMLGELASHDVVAPLVAVLADAKESRQMQDAALFAVQSHEKLDPAGVLLFLLGRNDPALTRFVGDRLTQLADRDFNGDAASMRAWIGSHPEAFRGGSAQLPKPADSVDLARLAANESSAISTLRNIASAQAQFQAAARVDVDGDGSGEFGFFREMTGAYGLRKQADGGAVGPPIDIPVLARVFRHVERDGETSRAGYVFRIFLPGRDGAAVAERPTGAFAEATDTALAETTWCAYAWPATHSVSGNRTFFVNHLGDVVATDSPAYSGPGAITAANAGAALRGEGALGSIVGDVAVAAPGRDGRRWTRID